MIKGTTVDDFAEFLGHNINGFSKIGFWERIIIKCFSLRLKASNTFGYFKVILAIPFDSEKIFQTILFRINNFETAILLFRTGHVFFVAGLKVHATILLIF